ncbi:MAG: hypothetical protein LBJ39_05270 [Tannerellaceae bacterium]|jgi:hypothetical protein|nr:hypothetical protein [Tannerellaceae bacterium]
MNRFGFYMILLALSFTEAQAQTQKILFSNKGLLYVKDSLFIQGEFYAEEKSEISQAGRTVLTGDFYNNVTSGNVFTTATGANKGIFEFRGKDSQQIKGSASKERYINFPDILSINMADASHTVTMQPNIAATAKKVDIVNGRLVLDSEAKGDTSTVNAHLLVENEVTGKAGGIQVNLALGDHFKKKRLVGFTSPFEVLYADYFFFNFLSRPTAKGLFGNDGRLITNPRTALKPGLGYIVGLGIIPENDPYYASALDPRWPDAKYEDRATDKFFFSRAVAKKSFSKYLNEQSSPGYISGEKLVIGDVTGISLDKGFNYLGNPYMAPLDLTDIVNGSTSSDWGVADNAIKNGFYVLSQGEGKYENSMFTFSASYLLRQKVGSTYDKNVVAPMQMFIVGAENATSMKIPKNKRKHDASSLFLRSAASDEPTDELLIETMDIETGGYDRLCIVFRNEATMKSDDQYDAVKIFNRSGGVNQIFTRSSDNKEMTTSIIPPSTGKLTMYFSPSSTQQQVELRADRLNSLTSVSYVTLEDTKTGVTTDLMRTPSYTFVSSPSDKADRFVLNFNPNHSSIDGNIVAGTPSASYEGGTLRIQGLRESDKGSDVFIFNMQGQVIYRQPLAQTEPCTINKYLSKGVYMVKNNATVIKFTVRD